MGSTRVRQSQSGDQAFPDFQSHPVDNQHTRADIVHPHTMDPRCASVCRTTSATQPIVMPRAMANDPPPLAVAPSRVRRDIRLTTVTIPPSASCLHPAVLRVAGRTWRSTGIALSAPLPDRALDARQDPRTLSTDCDQRRAPRSFPVCSTSVRFFLTDIQT